jgi:hypothetical protein
MHSIPRHIRTMMICILPLLFWGCPVRSIHPLFTEEQAITTDRVIGSWVTEGAVYQFDQLEGTHYRLTVISTEEGDSALYAARFGMIGKQLYLDTSPLTGSDEHHYLSVHVFSKVHMTDDSLSIETLDGEWLVKLSEQKKLRTPFVRRENEIILTGTPAELQRFMSTAANVPDAYPDRTRLVRSR